MCVKLPATPSKKMYFLLVVKNKSKRFTYFYCSCVRMLYFNASMSENTPSVFSIIIKESSRGWGGQSLLLPYEEEKATENILWKTRGMRGVLPLWNKPSRNGLHHSLIIMCICSFCMEQEWMQWLQQVFLPH